MKETGISWTHHTFNPWMGCQKVSQGCKHCYAEKMVTGRMGKPLWGPNSRRQVTSEATWKNVEKWQRDAAKRGVVERVFCASLADFFEDHPDVVDARLKAWELFRRCPNLHFQLLTKRPQNIRRFLPRDWGLGWANIWLGTSVESVEVAHRADILRQISATVKFISYEPALGPLHTLDLKGIDWVIFGGESGPGYRAADPQWARDMRDRCARERVTFFHKQSSAFRPGQGETLDGVLHHDFPAPRFVQLGIPKPALAKAGGGAGTVDGDGAAAADAETVGAGAVDGDGVAPPTDPSRSHAAA